MAGNTRKPTALDLFCGSGAVSLGLKQAGFEVIGAVDFDSGACRTYRENHPEVRLLEKDIRKAKPDEFSDLIEEKLDLLVVCAPCQPFSSQNRHRSDSDSRNNLVKASIPFIKSFKPSLVFLENVPGLESSDVFGSFIRSLKQMGYSVSEPMRIDASDHGVPQRRTRMILVAARGVSLEKAINIAKTSKRTVRETIEDLPTPPVGRPQDDEADQLHFARRHSPLNLRRLQAIPADGGGRESLPPELQLACHRNSNRKSSFSDTYGRMRWDDVSPTLTTGCTDITRGRYAHPVEHRAITLREAARLQSFPDNYIFKGNAGQISTQIGNAVPPEMMRNIAVSLKSALGFAEE